MSPSWESVVHHYSFTQFPKVSYLKPDGVINFILRHGNNKFSQLYVTKPTYTSYRVEKPPDDPVGPYGLLWDDKRNLAIFVYPKSYPWDTAGTSQLKVGLHRAGKYCERTQM